MRMKKVTKYILILTGIVAVYFAYHYSKHFVEKDELWSEKVTVPESGFIEIYHSHKCLRNKPFFIDKEEKINFRKSKFSVFDVCISDEEVEMLNAVSRYNIKESLERGYVFDDIEDVSRYEDGICDLSNRDYEVYYSCIGREVKKLSKPISGWSLLEDMGRDFDYGSN